MIAPAVLLTMVWAQAGSAPPSAPAAAVTAPALAAGEDSATAEVPVVARNVAAAKQRALDEALFQIVDRAVTAARQEAGAPPPTAAERAALRTRARRYVRSYRVLSETDAGTRYALQVAAEVDAVALRREVDRPASGVSPGTAGAPISVLVTGAPGGGTARAIATAFAAGGVRAETRAGADTDVAAAREQARKAGFTAVARYEVSSRPPEPLRGTGKLVVLCRLSGAVETTAGESLYSGAASGRVVGDGAAAAGDECARLAAASWSRAALPSVLARATAGGQTVGLDVEVDGPHVASSVLQALRRTPGVSSADLRRLTANRLDVRVATRLSPPQLASALARPTPGATVAFEPAGTTPEGLRVRAHAAELPGTAPVAPPTGTP